MNPTLTPPAAADPIDRPLAAFFSGRGHTTDAYTRDLDDFTAFHLSRRLGLIDALIAACAVGRSATLCTFNVKHYRVIADLVTEQPYTR